MMEFAEILKRALNVSFSTENRWENTKVHPSRMVGIFCEFCATQGIEIEEKGK